MSLKRTRWLLPFLSACTAVTLFAGPIAWADDNEHGDRGGDHGDGGDRVTVQVTAPTQAAVGENDDEDNAAVTRANALVAALNNQVAMLASREVEAEDADEAPKVGPVASISLATLETGLSGTDAGTVTSAVNANTAALHTFLSNGTVTATAINTALTAAGLNPANVLAILAGDERLIAITG